MYHYQYWLWSRDDIYSIKDTCISHFIEVLSLIFLKQVCYLVFFWNSLLGIPYPTKLGNFQYAFSSTPPLWLQNVVERNQTWILIRGSSSSRPFSSQSFRKYHWCKKLCLLQLKSATYSILKRNFLGFSLIGHCQISIEQ